MSHELYRHFNAEGDLLYIGISVNAFMRFSQHTSKNWHRSTASMTIERFESRELLESAEKTAIISEKPRHNVIFNRGNQKAEGEFVCGKLAIKSRLRTAIENSGKTHAEIAAEVGVDRVAVSQWQSDKQDCLPRLTKLAALCDALDIRPNFLFD